MSAVAVEVPILTVVTISTVKESKSAVAAEELIVTWLEACGVTADVLAVAVFTAGVA